jgi:hypothetical protein
VDKPPTYKPIVITTNYGYENMDVCLTCGALVCDIELHNEWHRDQEDGRSA